MDAYRQGDEFVVQLDLPGFEPSSIEVTAEQNVLTVSAERGWLPAANAPVTAWERPKDSAGIAPVRIRPSLRMRAIRRIRPIGPIGPYPAAAPQQRRCSRA